MTISHHDAIIIGAGISGISAAYHLQTYNKGKSYKILERRQALGGTWDLFNYPGIRSDSDMYTFGFSFRPWRDKSAIAPKDKILSYLDDTAQEYGIDKHIQYGVHIVKANWSSEQSVWTLEAGDGEVFTCRYIFICSGYYNYDEGHTPQFEGI
jgi:monooxygenase